MLRMRRDLFPGRERIRARAICLGERIDTRSLERGRALDLLPLTVPAGDRGAAVIFRYGAIVLFDLMPSEEAAFLEGLRPFTTGCYDEPESEEADLAIDPQRDGRVDADGTVGVCDSQLERLQIVAHILAKSVVLAQYEEEVAEVFDQVEPLARELQRGRGRAVPGRHLLRQIGNVLVTQARTVGRVEVAEKPEITWEEPDLERLYLRLGEEYELRERDHALDRKLELISRTAQTVLDILYNRRSLRVEWYIVILILVEIVLIVYDIVMH
jgi:uncharacterized Rmd1/YagE family protein